MHPEPDRAARLRLLALAALLLTLVRAAAQDTSPSLPAVTPTPATQRAMAQLQVRLDRAGFTVGFIDGRRGPRSDHALADYRKARGIRSGAVEKTLAAEIDAPPWTVYTVTTGDLARVGSAPPDWQAASLISNMACTSLVEVLSETFHCSPRLLQWLNPEESAWDTATHGHTLCVPNVMPTQPLPHAARLEIDCQSFRIRAYDSDGALVASFPVSIAADRSRVPAGALKITAFAPDPTYLFDPANFPESPRAQAIGRKLILPPGPNNPVGVFWMSLSRPGFGLHGTPHPETIGRPESHGCFRMTNWDVQRLSKIVETDTPLDVINAIPPATEAQ
ncbi:MAG: L,D-transpeptidase [bacterium]